MDYITASETWIKTNATLVNTLITYAIALYGAVLSTYVAYTNKRHSDPKVSCRLGTGKLVGRNAIVRSTNPTSESVREADLIYISVGNDGKVPVVIDSVGFVLCDGFHGAVLAGPPSYGAFPDGVQEPTTVGPWEIPPLGAQRFSVLKSHYINTAKLGFTHLYACTPAGGTFKTKCAPVL